MIILLRTLVTFKISFQNILQNYIHKYLNRVNLLCTENSNNFQKRERYI